MKISVLGLGYVGSVTAACLANKGHQVVGFDIDENKINMINSGKAPIVEPELNNIISESVRKGNLLATNNLNQCIMSTEITFVCVGTPSKKNNSLDLHHVEDIVNKIGYIIKNKSDKHVVVIRSTMLPGSMKNLVIPTLEKYSEKKAGIHFSVCINPEFMKEGSAVYDFYNPSQNVIGTNDDYAFNVLSSLIQSYTSVETTKLDLETAEFIKYSYNVWHALKVCYANELGNICYKLGIDSHKLMEVFCNDVKLNLSPYYLKPGLSFGGSCLPKDLRALLYEVKNLELNLPVINSIAQSNSLQTTRALHMILEENHKRIGFIGLSFKADTDDIRESPMVEIVERLLGKGFLIKIYDVNLNKAKNEFIDKSKFLKGMNHIVNLLVDSLDDLMDSSDLIVVGNKSTKFSEIQNRINKRHTLIDFVRVHDDVSSLQKYKGICW